MGLGEGKLEELACALEEALALQLGRGLAVEEALALVDADCTCEGDTLRAAVVERLGAALALHTLADWEGEVLALGQEEGEALLLAEAAGV